MKKGTHVYNVWWDGDRPVGIFGDSAVITIDTESAYHDTALIVEGLKDTFSKMWDVDKKYIHVLTDAELTALHED